MAQELIQRVENLLEALPPSATEIAGLLSSEGITGYPKLGSACPLATYLNEKTDHEFGNHYGAVGGVRAIIKDPISNVTLQARLPVACQEFVFKFDNGEYPTLNQNLREVP